MLLRAAGHSGRIETVEWSVYLSLLFVFPAVAIVVGILLPQISDSGARAAKGVVLSLGAGALLWLLVRADFRGVVASLAAATTTVRFAPCLSPWTKDANGGSTRLFTAVILIIGCTAAWMAAGSLVSWMDSVTWITGSLSRVVIIVASTALVIASLPQCAASIPTRRRNRDRGLDALALILLLALSFRTNPVIEFYHWTAYTGPMELMRQGGWLLWDVPSQYGFLSILAANILPGSSWQSFYLFQAIVNSVVAVALYRVLRELRPGIASWLVAVALTACTIFFRPRSATLLLPGQMTPSGGPPRFVLCFVMLGFVLSHYRRLRNGETEETADRRFSIVGNGIWLFSILWSAEAAIYVSAIWLPAYLLHIARTFTRHARSKASPAKNFRLVAMHVAAPITAVAVLVGIVALIYRAALGHGPDYTSYIEYAVLYSAGFNTLPIDTTGSVWFLVVFFVLISAAVIVYLSRGALHPRVMVVTAAWGGVWAISSYFVSRSHPANLLSITPFFVFAAAVTVTVMILEGWEPWHDFIRVALVPLFAFPIFLTIGHPGFVRLNRTPQLSYQSFTEQLPLMEASLNQLLVQAGAKPTDPVVRIADGRLMLPAWRDPSNPRARVMSPYSWLPKFYELIGSLPASRRQTYIDRNARDLRLSGWLVHSKKMTIPGFDEQLAQIQRTHKEVRRFENSDWILSWYELRAR